MAWRDLTAIGVLLAMSIAPCALPAESKAAEAGPVSTASGQVSGTFSPDGSVEVFRGIPFAAPPVGNLRWKPPQPAKPWSGVLHADHFSSSCVQTLWRSNPPWTKEFMTQNEVSEDCLYMNIWAPANAKSANLPVFVWIYGGAYRAGSGEIPVYDGTELAKTGMVVVNFNYRLGVFGFLSHPELTAESPHHSSGNYGILDQIAALNWVKQNIQAFGGDPNRVTICGQSAGAGSVHILRVSPLSRGLFQRAIAESGSGVIGALRFKLAEAEKQGKQFIDQDGAHTLTEMRALSADALMKNRFVYSLVVDGWIIPEPPQQAEAEGKQVDVPLITGWNLDDFRLRGGRVKVPSAEEFRKDASREYGNMAPDFLKLYPAGDNAQAVRSQEDSLRDQDRVDMYVWLLRQARTSKTPVYTYFFTRAIPDPEHPQYGVFHSAEIPYVLRNLAIFDRPWEPVDHHVSDVMSAYWKNFAETGDPNGPGLPHWAPASASNPTTLEIGANIGEIPVASPDKLRFWMKYLDSTPITRSIAFGLITSKFGIAAVLVSLLLCAAIFKTIRARNRPTI